jgi:hypothetical protein
LYNKIPRDELFPINYIHIFEMEKQNGLEPFDHLLEDGQKTMSVLVVFENRQPGICPESAMMDSTGHSRPNGLAIIKEE